jgi:DNA-binding transcriptional MerR regulator
MWPSVTERWRIDDLAQRSGVSVDTIRFYLREGLLPPAEREGRVTRFGSEHLARLAQIRDLQARRFNLAAIRRLVTENRLGFVDTLFAAGEGAYSLDELTGAAEVDPDLVRELVGVGLLDDAPPYDDSDVQAVAAVAGMEASGLPRHVVVALVRIYVDHFAAMRAEAAAIFAGETDVDWPDAERLAFNERAPERLATILPLTARILGHIHHRSVRRMTVQGMGLREE